MKISGSNTKALSKAITNLGRGGSFYQTKNNLEELLRMISSMAGEHFSLRKEKKYQDFGKITFLFKWTLDL